MNKKVLIVDDDEIVLFLHDLVIKQSGLTSETTTFADGLQALHYLNQQSHPVEDYLIFLDINMPVMNGWQLLSALETSHFRDRIMVVVVSSSIDPNDLAKSREFSMVKTYLSKPLSVGACLTLKGVLYP